MPKSITREFEKSLEQLENKVLNKVIRQAHREGAKILASKIKSKAPVDTGRAKRSVKVRAGKRQKNFISTNVEITGGHDEPFVAFVEFGTKDQAPNPFIRSSVIEKRDDVVDSIVNGIEKAI